MRAAVTTLLFAATPALAAPDLRAGDLQGPAVLVGSGHAAFRLTVSNHGTDATAPFSTSLRLSDDTAYFWLDDVALCTVEHPPLAAGASAVLDLPCDLPWDLPAGRLHVVARTGLGAAFAEADFLDNDAAFGPVTVLPAPAPIAGTPDLQVQNVSGPLQAAPGVPFSVDYTLHNIGDGDATSSLTVAYLSTNPTWDAADLEIGNESQAPLTAGSVRAGAVSCLVPNGTPGGPRYLIVRADATALVTEANEGNNTASEPVTVPGVVQPTAPDFSVSAPVSPSRAAQGARLSLSVSVHNTGDLDAELVRVGVVLSADATWDGGDVPLCEATVPSLPAGATVTATPSNCTVPAAAPDGAGFLLFGVDPLDQFLESDETNNVVSAPLDVGELPDAADLRVSGIGALPELRAGEPFDINYVALNQGTRRALGYTVRAFGSTDDRLQRADPLLCTDGPFGTPAADANERRLKDCLFPAELPTGDYYVMLLIDADDVVVEQDEENNVATVAVRLLAPETEPVETDDSAEPEPELPIGRTRFGCATGPAAPWPSLLLLAFLRRRDRARAAPPRATADNTRAR